MQDNSDFFRKIALRQQALREYSHERFTVADCYAGTGEITQHYWSIAAQQVLCIEQHQDKARHISGANVTVKIGRNVDFLAEIIACDVIDCDAYGLVMPFVRKLKQAGGSSKLIIFTDGTPEKGRKVYSAFKTFKTNLDDLFSTVTYELSNAGNAYYGYGYLK